MRRGEREKSGCREDCVCAPRDHSGSSSVAEAAAGESGSTCLAEGKKVQEVRDASGREEERASEREQLLSKSAAVAISLSPESRE